MTTANMGLTYVEYGDTQYTWGTTWNSNFTLMSDHDHSTGNGVQVALSSISIIRDFTISSYIYDANCIIFNSNTETLASTDRIYSTNGELFFNDSNFRTTQITSAGSLNYTTITGGGFSGDYVATGAECYYNGTDQAYYFYNDSTVLQGIEAYVNCTTYTNTNYTTDYISCSSSLTCNCSSTGLVWSFPVSATAVVLAELSGNLIADNADTAEYIVQTTSSTTEIRDTLLFWNDYNRSSSYSSTFIANTDQFYINDTYETATFPTSTYTGIETQLYFVYQDSSLNGQFNEVISITDMDITNSTTGLTASWGVYLPSEETVGSLISSVGSLATQVVPTATIGSNYFTTTVSNLLVPCSQTDTQVFYDLFLVIGYI